MQTHRGIVARARLHTAHVRREWIDLDALIGGWWAALDAARVALRSAERDLPASEVRDRTRRLADERGATVSLLDALARDRYSKRALVRLIVSPWEVRRLLGLPSDVAACVFNVDGVLVGSAAIHAEVWRQTFDELYYKRIDRDGHAFVPFSVSVDYPEHIHGKSRTDGVRHFLASRGLTLPEGEPDDPPGTESIYGLASRKKEVLQRQLREGDVRAYEGARLYLELARDAGLRCAVVSGSTTTQLMLDSARLGTLIDDRVDGNTMIAEGLHRKPAPDMLLAACRRVGAEPERTVVFETTRDGVAAGRAGGFEVVVGVDQGGDAAELRAEGADLVVSDLGEILEKQLSA